MPLEFLTDAQVAGYGRFEGVPSRADLERFFVLDEVDKKLINDRRGEHNRLGLMLQATTVRFVGRFLEDPLDVPWPVVEYVAAQLGITDASSVKRYTDRAMTAYEHAWQIRDAYGLQVLEDVEVTAQVRQFLDGRAWTHAEGPGALFDHGVGWLRRNRVLLPGITVLIRLVVTVREAAAARMHTTLAAAATAVDPMLPGRLRASLACPKGHGSPRWSPGGGPRPACLVRAWSGRWTGLQIWKGCGCGRRIVRRCRATESAHWPGMGWRARPRRCRRWPNRGAPRPCSR